MLFSLDAFVVIAQDAQFCIIGAVNKAKLLRKALKAADNRILDAQVDIFSYFSIHTYSLIFDSLCKITTFDSAEHLTEKVSH